MDNAARSFGRAALECASTMALLERERQGGHSERFATLDALVGTLLVQAVSGTAIVAKQRDALGVTTVALTTISDTQRLLLDDQSCLSTASVDR